MNTYLDYINLKSFTSENADRKIQTVKERIEENTSSIFTELHTAEMVAEDLQKYIEMKKAQFLMNSTYYKSYEAEGKPVTWGNWLSENY